MRLITRGAGAFLAVISALALAAGAAAASQPQRAIGHFPRFGGAFAEGAVFVQTDNLSGNAIVAYRRLADGKLTQTGVYPTGGLGGALEGSVVDHLASQGSLAYDQSDHLLYAVNAGSDTVSVFAVRGDQLARIQIIPSGGDFPVSIAVHGDLVYVLNARAGGSIQGYLNIGGQLRKIPTWNRPLGLNPTETPEFTHTPGQVAITPDGSKLLVTTKANGNAVEVFGLDRLGDPTAVPTATTLPEAVPFGVEFDAAGNPLIVEAGPNAVASFALDGSGHLHELSSAATGQGATCWIIRVGSKIYVSNAESGTVSGFLLGAGDTFSPIGNTATNGGTVDAAQAEGRFLYVQTGAEGIVDEFRIEAGGALASIGSVLVPGAVGGEGIAAS